MGASAQFLPDNVTPREKALVENVLQSGNISQSVIKAGYAPGSLRNAGVEGARVLRRARVASYLRKLCEESGATLPKALGAVSRALEAGETVKDEQGNVIGKKHDHAIQLQAADKILRMHGAYAADKTQSQSSKPNITKHLHLHGSEAVRAFVLAHGRLPGPDELGRINGQASPVSSNRDNREQIVDIPVHDSKVNSAK